MKGISLPINVLVIVAIAIIVLLGLIAMFFTGFGPFTTAVGLEGVKNSACRKLVQEERCGKATKDMDVADFDADRDGTPGESGNIVAIGKCGDSTALAKDNLFMLCHCYYGCDGTAAEIESCCKQLCACPGY